MVATTRYQRLRHEGGPLYEAIKAQHREYQWHRRSIRGELVRHGPEAPITYGPHHHELLPYAPRPCPWCGKTFTPKNFRHIVCSDFCRDQRKQGIVHRYPAKPRRRAKAKGLCKQCGAERIAQDRRNYCSERCQATANNERSAANIHRRRTLNEGDRGITITRLIKRDGNKCYLCNQSTRKTTTRRGKKRPSNKATIDHVTPIAQGGRHTWDNVRVACWACNIKKKAQSVGAYQPNLYEAGLQEGQISP